MTKDMIPPRVWLIQMYDGSFRLTDPFSRSGYFVAGERVVATFERIERKS